MKAKIVLLTPELAVELLESNIGNRKLKQDTFNFYVEQMLSGDWKENGEAIIIDKDGLIKDGQHRLEAVIKADYSYKVPIVYGVDPSVMDTIDTGTNRSLNDVLQLSGYKNYIRLAAITKRLNKKASKDNSMSGVSTKGLSNVAGLEYVRLNLDMLTRLNKFSISIYNASEKVLNATDIAEYLYFLSHKGEGIVDTHLEFMRRLTGSERTHDTSADYVYKKLRLAKDQKITLNPKWVRGIVIKAWNIFINGDASVRFIKFDTETPLPKIERIDL